MTQLDARGARTVAAMNPMTPVHHANGDMLDDTWTGHELTEYRIVEGKFSGPHYLIQLGHILDAGDPTAAAFRVKFIIHYPMEMMAGSNEEMEQANRCARAMMGMLNLRRKEFA